jgi:hypothetical protein
MEIDINTGALYLLRFATPNQSPKMRFLASCLVHQGVSILETPWFWSQSSKNSFTKAAFTKLGQFLFFEG